MYYGDFKNINDLAREFQVGLAELKGCKVLFAVYSYEDYSGNAFVLLRKNRKLYEVNACHCSCYGLEGQFELEETSLKALRHRYEKGNFGSNLCGYGAELLQVLDGLTRKSNPKVLQ